MIPNHQVVERSILESYVFEWDKDNCALVLGMASLVNHDAYANVEWNQLYECNMLEMVALRTIKKGEEIVFSYGPERWLRFRPHGPVSNVTMDEKLALYKRMKRETDGIGGFYIKKAFEEFDWDSKCYEQAKKLAIEYTEGKGLMHENKN